MSVSTSLTDESQSAEAIEPARKSESRFGFRWMQHFKALFGTPSQRRLAQAALKIPQIRHYEKECNRLSDDDLMRRGKHIKGRARGGESLDSLLAEVFGMICVASKRATNLIPYDVQLAAGHVLHHGALAEVAHR